MQGSESVISVVLYGLLSFLTCTEAGLIDGRLCREGYHPVYSTLSPFKAKCPALCRSHDGSQYVFVRDDLGWYNIDICSKCKVMGIPRVCYEFYCRKREICVVLEITRAREWRQ